MTSSQTRQRIAAFAMAAISGLAAALSAGVAFASQGPGGGPGTRQRIYPTGDGDRCLRDVSAGGRRRTGRRGPPAALGSRAGSQVWNCALAVYWIRA
jgi:hypothetical protein